MPNNLQITLTTPAAASVSVQTNKTAVSSLTIGQQATAVSLSSISDISAPSPQNGDVLQYSTANTRYEVKKLDVQGGSF